MLLLMLLAPEVTFYLFREPYNLNENALSLWL